MGEMRILDETGDTKQIWDKDKPDEVEVAEELFNKLTKKGYKAYRVDEKGEKKGEMKKFDPKAEMMILVPALVGG